MLPAAYPLALTRGDTFDFGVGLTDPAGVYADLTGYVLRVQIRYALPTGTLLAPDVAAGDLIHPTATFTTTAAPAATTIIRVTAPPASTEVWPVGVHLYDAELTSPAGVRKTYLLGPFDLAGDVTK